MRDLEKQIADWRRTMSKASGSRPELVDELEEHLREEIDRLVRSGISTDKVFEAAVSKFGSPSALAAEFDKLGSGAPVWMPVKLARIGLAGVAALVGCGVMLMVQRRGILLASHVACVTLGYLIMFTIGGLGICYVCARWFGEPGPAQRYSLLRSIFQFANLSAILTVFGVVLGMFWAKDNWGRYWAWDPKETGAVLILGWATLLSVLRWLKPAEATVVFMAILGNVVTGWGWFGANAYASGLSFPWLLVAFTASQLLLVVAGIVQQRALQATGKS
jgi:hypothetical protein